MIDFRKHTIILIKDNKSKAARIKELEMVVEKVKEFDNWFSKYRQRVRLDIMSEPDVEPTILRMWEHVKLALTNLNGK